MISNERLEELVMFKPSGANTINSAHRDEWQEMAKELLAYRKAFSEPVACTMPNEMDSLPGGCDCRMWGPDCAEPGDILLYRKPPTDEA